MLHAKIYIVDERVAFVGSSNLTFLGLMRNIEAGVRITDHGFIGVLREQFEIMWRNAESLSTSAFSEMVAALRSLKEHIRPESDHYYRIERSVDLFARPDPPSWSDSAVEYAASRPADLATRLFARSALAETPNSDAALAETSNSDAAKPAADEDTSGAEQADQSDARERILEAVRRQRQLAELHDKIAGAFIAAVEHRFGVQCDRMRNLYAMALCDRSVPQYRCFADEPDPPTLRYINVAEVWGQDRRSGVLKGLGTSAYRCACFLAAYKSGILERFGPKGVTLITSAADRLGTLSDYWHQNFLGPLLTHMAAIRDNEAHKSAAYRLLGAISISGGLSKAQYIVIAHPGSASGSVGNLAASTKRRTSSTEARFALAVLTTERKAA